MGLRSDLHEIELHATGVGVPRDHHGWKQLSAVTVQTYSDIELYERWCPHIWRGLEHEARRGTENLGVSAGTDLMSPRPPRPEIMIVNATEALSTQSAEHGTEVQIVAALANSPQASATEEPSTDPDPTTRDPGRDADHEL
ncbi:hypothetical protein ACIA8C_09935 [Nocardia sp. NPDC051321]|uniref:hypothetical protein n=1 Tax=Nocardia sp. NPDC051321 TaxID=3364323 RepID=UPI0037A95556